MDIAVRVPPGRAAAADSRVVVAAEHQALTAYSDITEPGHLVVVDTDYSSGMDSPGTDSPGNHRAAPVDNQADGLVGIQVVALEDIQVAALEDSQVAALEDSQAVALERTQVENSRVVAPVDILVEDSRAGERAAARHKGTVAVGIRLAVRTGYALDNYRHFACCTGLCFS